MTARPNIDERLIDEAVAWHDRLRADDADWTAFTLWLEAGPSHRQAFDEIALSDRVIDDHVPALRALERDTVAEVPRRSSRPWLYGAAAAALAIAIGLPLSRPSTPDTVYATRNGETRRISLPGGTTVALAPASRMIAKSGDATKLEIVAGEVFLSVKHDPNRVLAVRAGDYTVRDIGTEFALNHAGNSVVVSVAQGSVSVESDRMQTAELVAGQQFVGAGSSFRKARIDPSSTGSWRRGQLIYADAPLNIVLADISRYNGLVIAADPAIADRRFSGILFVGDGSKLLPDLAAFLAVPYRIDRDRAIIGSAAVR